MIVDGIGLIRRIRRIMVSALADDPEDVVFVDDEELVAFDLDFGATVFGDEHFVTDLNGEFDLVAFVVFTASAEADDFGFLGFFLGGVREDDAAGADCLGFETFDEDALSEWFDISHVVCVVLPL